MRTTNPIIFVLHRIRCIKPGNYCSTQTTCVRGCQIYDTGPQRFLKWPQIDWSYMYEQLFIERVGTSNSQN